MKVKYRSMQARVFFSIALISPSSNLGPDEILISASDTWHVSPFLRGPGLE